MKQDSSWLYSGMFFNWIINKWLYIAFGVKQRKPKMIEAAVGATIELESYLLKAKCEIVAPVQVEPKDALLEMMDKLMAWVDKLESSR